MEININIDLDQTQRQTQTQTSGGEGQDDDGKVEICHNGQTLRVAPEAVAPHLRNHPNDTFGPCSGDAESLPLDTNVEVEADIELGDGVELATETKNKSKKGLVEKTMKSVLSFFYL